MWFFLKILSGMANSVDPDQTAPLGLKEQSDLGLYCLHMPFVRNFVYEFLGYFSFTVAQNKMLFITQVFIFIFFLSFFL